MYTSLVYELIYQAHIPSLYTMDVKYGRFTRQRKQPGSLSIEILWAFSRLLDYWPSHIQHALMENC